MLSDEINKQILHFTGTVFLNSESANADFQTSNATQANKLETPKS